MKIILIFVYLEALSISPIKINEEKYINYIYHFLQESDIRCGMFKPTSHKKLALYDKYLLIPHLTISKRITKLDSLINLPKYLIENKKKEVRHSFFYTSDLRDTAFLNSGAGAFNDVVFLDKKDNSKEKYTYQFTLNYSKIRSFENRILGLDKINGEAYVSELFTRLYSKNAELYCTVNCFLYSIWYYKNGYWGVIYLDGQKWVESSLINFLNMYCDINKLRKIYDKKAIMESEETEHWRIEMEK